MPERDGQLRTSSLKPCEDHLGVTLIRSGDSVIITIEPADVLCLQEGWNRESIVPSGSKFRKGLFFILQEIC